MKRGKRDKNSVARLIAILRNNLRTVRESELRARLQEQLRELKLENHCHED
jgi:hypothetical protein